MYLYCILTLINYVILSKCKKNIYILKFIKYPDTDGRNKVYCSVGHRTELCLRNLLEKSIN